MRVLVSLVGPDGGQLVGEARSITRLALGKIPHDHVHVLTVEPEHEEIAKVQRLCERTGAGFSVDELPPEDLRAAFHETASAIRKLQQGLDGTVDVAVQVNAGRHANLASSAGLLACLHEGVPAHFVHEEGHDELTVLARAPLSPLLSDAQEQALVGFPEDGILLSKLREHDVDALTGLKDQGLVEPGEARLRLTDSGRAYQQHLASARTPPGEAR